MPVATTARACIEDYRVPGSDLIIKKNDMVTFNATFMIIAALRLTYLGGVDLTDGVSLVGLHLKTTLVSRLLLFGLSD